jgi:hypothetical protein
MTTFSTSPLLAAMAATLVAGGAQAEPNERLLEAGAYQVEVRLEIPNVWTWSAAKTVTICVPEAHDAGAAPLPVLSGNNPLADCPADEIERTGGSLTYVIACHGRDGARARAAYSLTDRAFQGRIRMVMGAKNMTFMEVQTGRRIGNCGLAVARPD